MSTPGDPFWRERRAARDGGWTSGLPPAPLEPTPEPPLAQPPPPPAGRAALLWAGLGALVGGLIGGGIVAGLVVLGDDDNDVAPAAAQGDTQPIEVVKQDDAIIQVADRARPGVVRIESSHRTPDGVVADIGSGVVLDKEGHVLTNAHVVLNTETLKVFLADGSERPAIIIGHDSPFTDLAVLQIGPLDVQPIEVGDSDALALGQTVVAIGNPLSEFHGSVTVGVVSGLNRVRTLDGVQQEDLIQTDAAVNNGNSGGALLNLGGQLVGLPTLVIRSTRSNQPVEGIAFAIPSNRALAVARGIIAANGVYPRPALGVEHLDITPDVASRFSRLATGAGAIVASVAPGGPAAEAGIQTGDIITKIGDNAVDADHPFLNGLMQYEPGETVKVVLNRNGRIIEADVRLAKRS